MNAAPASYTYTQKGRSVYSALVVGFAAILAVLLFLTRDTIGTAVGVGFVFLVCSGIFAFLKGETWSMSIQDGVLTWAYTRWPKSSGRINLGGVHSIVIDDSSGTLTFSFAFGGSQKIKFIGYGSSLRDYLRTHHSQIYITYLEGT